LMGMNGYGLAVRSFDDHSQELVAVIRLEDLEVLFKSLPKALLFLLIRVRNAIVVDVRGHG